MPRTRLGRRNPQASVASEDKLTNSPSVEQKEKKKTRLMRRKLVPTFSTPAKHEKILRSPTNIAPPSPLETSPIISPCDDFMLPQAMSTPRSVVDDFLLSQSDQVDVRWDTSSPDAYIKAKKVASKDFGRSTIQMLAAGIKSHPLEEAPTTPALIRLWLVRDHDQTSDGVTTPRSDHQRRRCSRRIRTLQDKTERDASTNNLMKKLSDLIEQQRESDPEPQPLRTSSSDELTFSAAVAQLQNLSTDDFTNKNDDNIFNNSAILEPSAIIHPIPFKRTPRAKNNHNHDVTRNSPREYNTINNAEKRTEKENPVDSSWEDDDLFLDDDFIAQASQITEALYDPGTQRFRTPKASKLDNNRNKRETPLRSAMRNSASKSKSASKQTTMAVERNQRSMPSITSIRNNVIPESGWDRRSGPDSLPAMPIACSTQRSNNTVLSIPRLRKGNNTILAKKQHDEIRSLETRSTKSSVGLIASVEKSVPVCAHPISNEESHHYSRMTRDTKQIRDSRDGNSVHEKTKTVFDQKSRNHQGNGFDPVVQRSESNSQDGRVKNANAGFLQVPKGTKSVAIGEKFTSVEIVERAACHDDSLPDDILLQLAEPDTLWESQVSCKSETDHLWDDDDDDGDAFNLAKEEISPLPATVLLSPSPVPERRANRLAYKPDLGKGRVSESPAQHVDAFDGDDDSFCHPEILAKLEQVEFEATQSQKTSQSPAKSSKSLTPASSSSQQQCTLSEIQRKRAAALRKRRLVQTSKLGAKRGKYYQ